MSNFLFACLITFLVFCFIAWEFVLPMVGLFYVFGWLV